MSALSSQPVPERALGLHTYAWEDATVVRCTGRLTAETSPLLKAEAKALLPNKRRVILDLTELGYMDSSGLGTLVAIYISAKDAGALLLELNDQTLAPLGPPGQPGDLTLTRSNLKPASGGSD